ncbi:MAG: hypothetical protein ABR568_21455, partial [Pyrinomonadaceae bacterium]
ISVARRRAHDEGLLDSERAGRAHQLFTGPGPRLPRIVLNAGEHREVHRMTLGRVLGEQRGDGQVVVAVGHYNEDGVFRRQSDAG